MSCAARVVVPIYITADHIISSNLSDNDPYPEWSPVVVYRYGEIVSYRGALMRSNTDIDSGNNPPVLSLGENPKFAAVPSATILEHIGSGDFENLEPFDELLGYSEGDRFYDPHQNGLVIEALETVPAGVYPPVFTSEELEDETAWDFWKYENSLRLFDMRDTDKTTSDSDTMTIVIRPAEAWTHIALFGIEATSVTVFIEDSFDNEIFNETYDTACGADDWWDFFFGYTEVSSDLVVDVGGPGYINKKLTLTIIKNDSKPSVGIMFVGNELEIGQTLMGLSSGGRSYSEVTSNAFGVTGISAGATVRDLDIPTIIDNDNFDIVSNAMKDTLGQVVLLIGADRFSTTVAYGLAQEFTLSVEYSDYSTCSYRLETLI